MDGRLITFEPGTVFRQELLFALELRETSAVLRGPWDESSPLSRMGTGVARFDRVRPDGIAVYRWIGVREA